jgi:hypothetical protein
MVPQGADSRKILFVWVADRAKEREMKIVEAFRREFLGGVEDNVHRLEDDAEAGRRAEEGAIALQPFVDLGSVWDSEVEAALVARTKLGTRRKHIEVAVQKNCEGDAAHRPGTVPREVDGDGVADPVREVLAAPPGPGARHPGGFRLERDARRRGGEQGARERTWPR